MNAQHTSPTSIHNQLSPRVPSPIPNQKTVAMRGCRRSFQRLTRGSAGCPLETARWDRGPGSGSLGGDPRLAPAPPNRPWRLPGDLTEDARELELVAEAALRRDLAQRQRGVQQQRARRVGAQLAHEAHG